MNPTPFIGSGEFVQEREWTCSKHDYPMRHECDCDRCSRHWDCRGCAQAAWRDLRNPDGSPLLRELSALEAGIRRWNMQMLQREAEESKRFLDLLKRDSNGEAVKFVWNEDPA